MRTHLPPGLMQKVKTMESSGGQVNDFRTFSNAVAILRLSSVDFLYARLLQ